MELLIKSSLIIHIAAGVTALLVAPVAMAVKKGGRAHSRWGLIFFWAMTVIFVTALFLSTIKWIPFLLMIAVFSYYSVFSAYRWKFLKRLYNGKDKLRWFDWAALVINGLFNIAFMSWGLYLILNGSESAFPYLALGFGFFGFRISYGNYKLFTSPHESTTWFFEHLGGMVGGFIATLTAFSAQTMIFLPDFIQWAWPSMVGVPLISYWSRFYKKKFKTSTT